MFTYRDFEMGTLGLAWTGDLKNAGGVCEKNGVSHESLVAFKRVPGKVPPTRAISCARLNRFAAV